MSNPVVISMASASLLGEHSNSFSLFEPSKTGEGGLKNLSNGDAAIMTHLQNRISIGCISGVFIFIQTPAINFTIFNR